MKNLLEKLNAEIEKGRREAEEMKAAANLPDGPDTDARRRKARAFNRQVSGFIALTGVALCAVVYGFYLKDGSLFYGLALLGVVCTGFGISQAVTGRTVKGG